MTSLPSFASVNLLWFAAVAVSLPAAPKESKAGVEALFERRRRHSAVATTSLFLWRIYHYLRRRFADFNLSADFLNLRRLSFNSRRESCHCGLQFLDLAVLFEEFVEQHCVHRVVPDAFDFTFAIADCQVWIHLRYILGD